MQPFADARQLSTVPIHRSDHQPFLTRVHRRVVQRVERLAERDPVDEAGTDVPGERGGHEQGDQARHGADREGARCGAAFLGRLARTLDAEVVPDAELQRGEDAEPPVGHLGIGAPRWVREQRLGLGDGARIPELGSDDQHEDGDERDRRDDEVEGQRRVHAPVVEPREERDGEHYERGRAEVCVETVDDGADDEAVAGRQHAVFEDDEQRDVEGCERAEDVLGLGVLPPAEATVELTSESIMATQEYRMPENQQATRAPKTPPLATVKFQPMNSPDEHDADPEGPDVHRPEHAQQAEAFRGCGRARRDCHLLRSHQLPPWPGVMG